MSVEASVRYITLLATVWRVAEVTSSKVDQFPTKLTVHGGNSVSMFCTFSISQTTPNVSWWRRGEKRPVEPDGRKQFTVKKGGASFVILNASVADSGMYYCKVKHQQQFIGDGPGSNLTVFAPPTPLKIFLVEEASPNSRKLMCKTAAFYPDKFLISWLRDGVTIVTGIENVKTRSMEGLYEASSFLEITSPAWSKDVYSCLVSHESLTVPARVNYTVERDSTLFVILRVVEGILVILLAFMIFVIIFPSVKGSVLKVGHLVDRTENTKESEQD